VNMIPKDELQKLLEMSADPSVSIFMPTHRTGVETQQDPIRLKNLLSQAEKDLVAYGLRSPEVRELLSPVQALLEDNYFWQHQSDGLSIFITADLFQSYRLPVEFEALVVVADRFHLKPLLPLLSGDGRFYILALSQNEVRFLQGTRYSVNEVDLPDIPKNMADALKYDEAEKQLQFHTGASAGEGSRAGIFHGHGAGRDDSKENIKRYLRQVAKGIQQSLNEEQAPLVLAGVDSVVSIYRMVNAYPYLLEDKVAGNPETLSASDLHKQAWAIVEPYFLEAQEEAIAQYQQLAQTERASGDIREIVPAAYYGRIEKLLVAVGAQQWGAFDPGTNTMHLREEAQPGDEDLLDAAAVQTLLKGGTIYALPEGQMPEERPLAAVFRYW